MKNLILILLTLVLVSCSSRKDIIYYQGIDDKVFAPLPEIYSHQEIQVNDILDIKVSSLNPESVAAFTPGGAGAMGGGVGPEMLRLTGYLVDANGYIQYPQVGKIYLKGKSTIEAQNAVKEAIKGQVKYPNVKIILLNYKFTIQGEVNSPGTFEIIEENITLLQALGMAGDLTINGMRENIMIIRQIGDERIVKRINLNQTDWMDTPFYYVKQNDVIYVEPNRPRVKAAGYIPNLGVFISVISAIISISLTIIVLSQN